MYRQAGQLNAIMSSNLVHIGLVGLGGHGRTIQKALLEAYNLKVMAVYDPSEMEVRAAARRFDCDAVSSLDEIVARDDVDAVALVTPNHLHRSQAELALKAGKHVFVEKPLANTVKDGHAMVRTAAGAGLVLMVGHNMRWGRAARKTKRLMDQGALGKVVSAEFHFSLDSGRRLPRNSWRLRPTDCQLLPVMQLGIHAIDLFHYFFGSISEVFALARSVLLPVTIKDSVVSTFRAESGVTGTLVSNYCTQVTFAYRIAGTDGSILGTPHTLRFRRNADTDPHGDGPTSDYDYRERDLESFILQLEAFGEAISARTTPETDGWAGLRALAVVEAMNLAAKSRRLEKVDLRV